MMDNIIKCKDCKWWVDGICVEIMMRRNKHEWCNRAARKVTCNTCANYGDELSEKWCDLLKTYMNKDGFCSEWEERRII